MKKIILFSMFLYVCVVCSAEFEVISFEKNPMDLSARKMSTKLTDAKGNDCAIIKIQTDISGITFLSESLERVKYSDDGEYWIYMQSNSKRMKINKDQVNSLTYNFPMELEKSTVYIMKLSAEGISPDVEIAIAVFTDPNDAKIKIDGKDIDTSKQIITRLGKHKIQIARDGYLTKVENIDVAVDNTMFEFKLNEEWKAEYVFVKGGTINDTDITVSDFYIAKYEVTQAQWKSVMGSNPSYFKGHLLPVGKVNWYDAVEFCNKLSVIEGLNKCYKIDRKNKDKNNLNEDDNLKYKVICNFKANGYRLPTEAEWEYAAKGGNKSRGYTYSGSNDLEEVAECRANNMESVAAVGGLKPNELDIYDMSGNVSEWCWDWYGEDYYKTRSRKDPIGPRKGKYRVTRGGDYYTSTWFCTVIYRFNTSDPTREFATTGFRVVKKP